MGAKCTQPPSSSLAIIPFAERSERTELSNSANDANICSISLPDGVSSNTSVAECNLTPNFMKMLARAIWSSVFLASLSSLKTIRCLTSLWSPAKWARWYLCLGALWGVWWWHCRLCRRGRNIVCDSRCKRKRQWSGNRWHRRLYV